MSTSTIKSVTGSVAPLEHSGTGSPSSHHDGVNQSISPPSVLAQQQPVAHFEGIEVKDSDQQPKQQQSRIRRKSSIRASSVPTQPKSDYVESVPSNSDHLRQNSSVRQPVSPPSQTDAPVTSAPAGSIPQSSNQPPLVPFFAVTAAPVTQQPGPAPYSAKARPAVPPPPLPPRFAALAAVKGLPTMSGVIPKSVLQQSKKNRSGKATMWEEAEHSNTRDDVHDLRFRTRLRLPLVPMADYQEEKKRLGEDPLMYECPWRTYPRRPQNSPLTQPRLVHDNFRVWSIDTREIQQSSKPQRSFLNKMDNTFQGPYFYAPNIKGPIRKKSYPLCKTKQESADAAAASKRKVSRQNGPKEAPAQILQEELGETASDGTEIIAKETQTDED